MDDLISRQAAIDVLAEWHDPAITNRLNNLPSVQQWIPCSVALPEKGKYVLCQCRAGIMDVLRLTDDNGWYKDSTHIYMHRFVVAWCPLPAPYRTEGDEKHEG